MKILASNLWLVGYQLDSKGLFLCQLKNYWEIVQSNMEGSLLARFIDFSNENGSQNGKITKSKQG